MGLAQHTSQLNVGERTERDRAREASRLEAHRLWAAIDERIAVALAEEYPDAIDQEADDAPQPLLR